MTIYHRPPKPHHKSTYAGLYLRVESVLYYQPEDGNHSHLTLCREGKVRMKNTREGKVCNDRRDISAGRFNIHYDHTGTVAQEIQFFGEGSDSCDIRCTTKKDIETFEALSPGCRVKEHF